MVDHIDLLNFARNQHKQRQKKTKFTQILAQTPQNR